RLEVSQHIQRHATRGYHLPHTGKHLPARTRLLCRKARGGLRTRKSPKPQPGTQKCDRPGEQAEQENSAGKRFRTSIQTTGRKEEISSKDEFDATYRRLRYCRYADDFVLSVICPKSEAEEIYRKIEIFLHDELKLKTSPTKSGLKHNTETIRFLGYDITVRNT